LQNRNLELEHEIAALRAEKGVSEAQTGKTSQKRKKNDAKETPLKHKKLNTGKATPVAVSLPDLEAAREDSHILEAATDTGKCHESVQDS